MSSDYEPHGSISNNQLAPQRKHKDTYFGELVLKNTKTGENTADNIKMEIFDGANSKLRRFHKAGLKYGFNASLSFPTDYDDSGYLTFMETDTGFTIDNIGLNKHGDVNQKQQAQAVYTQTRDFLMADLIDASNGDAVAIGSIMDPTNTTLLYIANIRPPFTSNFGTSEIYSTFEYTDGTEELTNLPEFDYVYDDTSWDPAPGVPAASGFFAEYYVTNPDALNDPAVPYQEKRYYYSDDAFFYVPADNTSEAELYPIVSFQDNGNGELPYEATTPPEDYEHIRRHKTLRALGVDFEGMSRQIFSYIPAVGSAEWNSTYRIKFNGSPRLQAKYLTEQALHDDMAKEINIPAFGSPEWSSYRRSWKANIKNCCKTRNLAGECVGSYDNDPRPEQITFCDDNPTEQAYYDGLVADKAKAAQSIRNITDVHFGLFASAKQLDEESCVALFFTLQPVMSIMEKSPVPYVKPNIFNIPSLDSMGKAYKFKLTAGSLKVEYGFGDWSVCRRYGIADPILYAVGVKTAKYRHGDYTILEDSALPFDTGYTHSNGATYSTLDPTYAETRPPDWDGQPSETIDEWLGTSTYAPGSMLELRVQEKPDPITGEPRFLELRLYDPVASHTVDVIRDGEHGKPGRVVVVGGLTGIYSDPSKYSDVLMWPISRQATEEVRFFKIERFTRECTVVNICAIKMEEVKWYQQGWFAIVMVIVSLVVAYFTGYFGLIGIQASLAAGATMAVLYVVSLVVENPILKAIISIAIMYFTGYVDTNSLMQNAALVIEAAGVVLQAKIAMDMIELQDKMDAFRQMVNEKEKDMEKMKKEVGMDEHNKEWMLYIASLAPVETPEDFFTRALNKDLCDTSLDTAVAVDTIVPTPQG